MNDVLETINTLQKEITDLENIQRQCENNFSKIEKYEKFIFHPHQSAIIFTHSYRLIRFLTNQINLHDIT